MTDQSCQQSIAKAITQAVLDVMAKGGDNLAIYEAVYAALPAVTTEGDPTKEQIEAGAIAMHDLKHNICDDWASTEELYRNVYRTAAHACLTAALPAAKVAGGDWKDDPSADERWNAGCDFALEQLGKYLGIDLSSITWDGATETVEGDVEAVIGNILRAKLGDDWSPDASVDVRAAVIEAAANIAKLYMIDLSESQMDDRDIELIRDGANRASNEIADAIAALSQSPATHTGAGLLDSVVEFLDPYEGMEAADLFAKLPGTEAQRVVRARTSLAAALDSGRKA